MKPELRLHLVPVTAALASLALAALAAPPAAPRGPAPAVAAAPGATAALTALQVGEAAFNDKSLSAAGNLACASCHVKARAYTDPAGTLLPLGGVQGTAQGHRSSMSLAYLNTNTALRFDPTGQPVGGFFWDGRAPDRIAQSAGPLFNASEMANTTYEQLAAKVRAAPWYNDLVAAFSPTRSLRSAQVVDLLQQALAAYQAGDSDFALYNSKFDRVLDGTAQFTAAEARGFAAFNDPQRGNCASCHTSAVGTGGERPLFSNFTYHALGLPRNTAIQANADPNYRDMGLCGPDRTDLALRVDLCGAFRVPTLRNVALSAPYFHNATANTLPRAVNFYATRDIAPQNWYPLLNGQPDKFNDLPLGFRGNVVQTAPFGRPLPGQRPHLTPQDESDIVAFLNTLTDDATLPPGSPFVAPHRAGR